MMKQEREALADRMAKPFLDDDGIPILSGDYIIFSFGIPPTTVLAIVSGEHDLQIECLSPPDVKPRRESLKNLMKWYQVWKAPKARVAAYLKDYAP